MPDNIHDSPPIKHTWKFFRAGDFDQVRIETTEDLTNLQYLDQKLWVALACPTTNIEFDPVTLNFIDTDKDGRIRAPEIIAAVNWACARVKNPADLLRGSSRLSLSAINDATDDGKQLLASARQILANLGKTNVTELSVEDTSDSEKIFAQTKFNGDGIVPPDSADFEPAKNLINDVVACVGGENDRSGKSGVSVAKLDQFFAEAEAYSQWWKQAQSDNSILPMGHATFDGAAALDAVRKKVDDYFTRCRVAEFDSHATTALNPDETTYQSVASQDLAPQNPQIANLPLSRVQPGHPLPLRENLNPAWAEPMQRFYDRVVKPLLGETSALTEAEWSILKERFARYEQWHAAQAGTCVDRLGIERVNQILGSDEKTLVLKLIEQDKALESQAGNIASVTKLVRLNRDLKTLLNNFVAFRDFYSRERPAIFQTGTLYLDQRSCDLCLAVEDPGRHAAMAGLAGVYLAYCDCVRRSTNEKRTIVAAFTAGDSDNLMIGRNGLFYDRRGVDWDATITKLIDNPIIVRQAFFAPYKKLVRIIEEHVAKRAAAAGAEADAKLASVTELANPPKPAAPGAPATPAAPKTKIDTGTLAAIGLVMTSLLGALSMVFSKILGLEYWQIPLAFLAIILAISAPSVIIAWLKLRKRNIGPILDANGWAVNARARINVPFGGSLTKTAKVPFDPHRSLTDPFAEKRNPWRVPLIIVLTLFVIYTVLDKTGLLHDWFARIIGR